MYRSHNCGELRLKDKGATVILAGWVQRVRDMGGMSFLDLRDREGITQLIISKEQNDALRDKGVRLGREFVLSAKGLVEERSSKNPDLATGEIEIIVKELTILNSSKTPPFTIEAESDGGEDLRMKYRYLDLRRPPLQKALRHRHQVLRHVRSYLDDAGFLEVETPYLIKSTPEGARDFVVPSRMNPGQFYALPQSPQTFKQLLMVSGYDKYYQIVKCFRDEDLRADRQPEFSQIDCELSFVTQEDIFNTFSGLIKHVLKEVKGIEYGEIERITFADAMRRFGSDKPDMRFGMEFCELNELAQNKGFQVFDSAELVVGIAAPGCSEYSRKQIDALTDWVKRPQIGAQGLVYVKCNEDGTFKSSVDKFYSQDDLKEWAEAAGAKAGDLILILAGAAEKTRKALNELRLYMGGQLGLRKADEYHLTWVVDFPLLEYSEDDDRWVARHHPFTRPRLEDMQYLDSDPGRVRAEAYDLVMNGNEIAGGSIRIHERDLQEKMFKALGMPPEESEEKFGFLMQAFEYGAPPHGGMAFGLDRLVALLGGSETIRDYIAFPKNNSGRDVMLDAPANISDEQLEELSLKVELDGEG